MISLNLSSLDTSFAAVVTEAGFSILWLSECEEISENLSSWDTLFVAVALRLISVLQYPLLTESEEIAENLSSLDSLFLRSVRVGNKSTLDECCVLIQLCRHKA